MIPEYLSPLANHLWQSTIVAGLAAVLALALRKNAARVRYWLWLVPAAKFLFPFSLLVNIGHQFEWRTAPAITQRPIYTVADFSMPFAVTPNVQVLPSAAPNVNPIPLILFSVWLCGFAVSVWFWIRSWRRI